MLLKCWWYLSNLLLYVYRKLRVGRLQWIKQTYQYLTSDFLCSFYYNTVVPATIIIIIITIIIIAFALSEMGEEHSVMVFENTVLKTVF
jgi:hypothetical protein